MKNTFPGFLSATGASRISAKENRENSQPKQAQTPRFRHGDDIGSGGEVRENLGRAVGVVVDAEFTDGAAGCIFCDDRRATEKRIREAVRAEWDCRDRLL